MSANATATPVKGRTAPPGPPSFRARIAALGRDHPLAGLLEDQLRILRRLGDDPPDFIPAGAPLGECHREMTEWEHAHLERCLGEWLDVLEANALTSAAADPPQLNVRDFGAVGDGVSDDGAAIQRALAAAAALGAGTVLRFPAGRYVLGLAPEKPVHLLIRGLCDVTLAGEAGPEGAATEFVGGGHATLVRFEDCHNVRVRNIAFDYDPPLFSQGRVVSIAADRCALVWRMDEGYPAPEAPLYAGLDRIPALILDRDDKVARLSHGGFAVARWESVGPGLWRLQGDAGQKLPPHAEAGCALLLYRRYKWTQAVVVSGCSWMDFEQVEVWGAPELAFYVESSTGVSLRRSHIRPKPGTGRLGGLNADGFHARSNRYGPFLSGCSILRVLDDCLNIQSRMVSLADADPQEARTVVLDLPWHPEDRIGYWHPSREDYAPGDLLLFVDPAAGILAGWAFITSVEPCLQGGFTQMQAHLDRPIRGLLSRRALAKQAPVASSSEFLSLRDSEPLEHFVINASTKSDGFVIRDCTMGHNTVTCGKIKAANGLIAGNRTFNHGWCVWSFATEYVWQEGYAARRILLEKNEHDNWFGIYIGSQHPFGRSHLGPPLNCLLDIRGNTFRNIAPNEFAVDANAVMNCTITGNVLPPRSIVAGPTASGVRIADNLPVPAAAGS